MKRRHEVTPQNFKIDVAKQLTAQPPAKNRAQGI
ncbi:hypothetical protein AVDCRST_MAG81-5232 [uncultured Synechococcales cyanobacterium]|uniref:Uncharacterized protein n=1 Tax=uncultured Synechococcales cyanobacterium TaxID=1936017 RepID=A0A6J4VVF9_9CYAN|nr:hypothetical protein AVDCRST_MAG81-5232 [uncultured Synechococcales cyanobacterium]